MKIYIDFDGTIYNSQKLVHKFITILKKYNIDENFINEHIIKENNNSIYNQNKNLDILTNEIIKQNNLDKSILKEINDIYSKDLIFEDSISFLEKYYQKYDLILLTLGEQSYQLKKINSCNINKYFKDIIITNQNKSKLNIDYHNGIFIDNNPLELEKFKKANANNLIRIKRESDKYSLIDLHLDNTIEFKDFFELIKSNYIDKISEDYYE